MDTSALMFCPFSPLTTPLHKQAKKVASSAVDSDVDSVSSFVTRDIRKLAQSVSANLNKKQKKKREKENLVSEDDHLVSQEVTKFGSSIEKIKKQKTQKPLTDNSTSTAEKVTNVNKHNRDIMSSKVKKGKSSHALSESSDSSSESDNAARKPITSSGLGDVASDICSSSDPYMTSDSDCNIKDDAEPKLDASPTKSRPSKSGKLDSTVSSGVSKTSPKKSKKKTKDKTVRRDSESEDDDERAATSISSKHSKKSKKVILTDGDEVDRLNGSTVTGTRFKVPQGFERKDASTVCLKQSDIEGKQLWLIQVPKKFDISVLNKQKVNMSGHCVIAPSENDEEASEKQYEVFARKNTQQQGSNFHSIAVKNEEELVVGAHMAGQMMISDWIPVMPPIEFVKSPPRKHRVPDNLHSSYQLFGSTSPPRHEQIQEVTSPGKKKKHKNKKKHHTSTETQSPESVKVANKRYIEPSVANSDDDFQSTKVKNKIPKTSDEGTEVEVSHKAKKKKKKSKHNISD